MISSRDAMTKKKKAHLQSPEPSVPRSRRSREVPPSSILSSQNHSRCSSDTWEKTSVNIWSWIFFAFVVIFFVIILCSLFLLPWTAQDGSKTFASYFRHLPFPLPLQSEFFHVAVMSKVKPSRRGWPCRSSLGRRCQTPPARQCSLETNTSQVLGNCGSFSPPLPLLVGYELTMSSNFLM